LCISWRIKNSDNMKIYGMYAIRKHIFQFHYVGMYWGPRSCEFSTYWHKWIIAYVN
jgi:hypothetical protein